MNCRPKATIVIGDALRNACRRSSGKSGSDSYQVAHEKAASTGIACRNYATRNRLAWGIKGLLVTAYSLAYLESPTQHNMVTEVLQTRLLPAQPTDVS